MTRFLKNLWRDLVLRMFEIWGDGYFWLLVMSSVISAIFAGTAMFALGYSLNPLVAELCGG